MIDRIEDILHNRHRYDRKECVIGSILTIDDECVSFCKYFYYCNWSIG